MKVANPADLTLLNNAIWYALSTEQAHLAEGNHLAKRFPGTYHPSEPSKPNPHPNTKRWENSSPETPSRSVWT
jgi:hypothetical protein